MSWIQRGRPLSDDERARLFAEAITGRRIPAAASAVPTTTMDQREAAFLRAILGDEEFRRRFPTEPMRTEHRDWVQEVLGPDPSARWVHGFADWPDAARLLSETWDASKHPRRGGPPNAGWWASTEGSGRDRDEESEPAEHPWWYQTVGLEGDSARGYLPSHEKGTWLGEKGNSTFRLHKPVDVNGKKVREITFKSGVPDLDEFTLPGKAATIVITGDNNVDQRNARRVWKELNPNAELPPGTRFHHDLLHARPETTTIRGKPTKVLVGEMRPVPASAHGLFHQGSKSVANDLYKSLGRQDKKAIRDLATREASLAGKSGSFVAKAAKKITPGKIHKTLLPFVGRSLARIIPIATTGLALFEFGENVEAHGIGGALVRATPVLSELMSAYDVGTDLAKQIRDDATARLSATYRSINEPVDMADEKATQQTLDAFNELASQIEVTNPYSPDGRVDPSEVEGALRTFHEQMLRANLLKARQGAGYDFDSAAASAKRELKEHLTKACQKNAPPPRANAL